MVRVEDLKRGEARLVILGGEEVALFNVEGRFYAVGNRCPHRSGPLVCGHIERVPDDPSGTLAVRCPIHGWLFDLATGQCLTRTSARIPTFPVTCHEGEVCLSTVPGTHP